MKSSRPFPNRTWACTLVILLTTCATAGLATPPAAASASDSSPVETFALIEGGVAWGGYNDVRIPPETGTEFSLTEDLASDPASFIRLRLGVRVGDRHTLSLLAAPLRISSEGRFDRTVHYQGVDFPAGEEISATYRFDSYRLTYRYSVYQSDRLRADIGVTAKIRDAEIELMTTELQASKTNVGVVPLISFALCWQMADAWNLILDGDALASPGGQGRAEDVFVGVQRALRPGLAVRAGYRILEGGADVDEVYNFAVVHYASVGFVFSLAR